MNQDFFLKKAAKNFLASKTLPAQSKKYAPGHQTKKERFTIMTCWNASDHKLKVTFIRKAKKLFFKGTEIRSFSCMNQTIFSS